MVEFVSGGDIISLTKTGPKSATMVENGTEYDLQNITVRGMQFTCDVAGQPFDVVPHLIFDLYKTDLRVTITSSWVDDGTKDYPITTQEADEIEAFVKTFSGE